MSIIPKLAASIMMNNPGVPLPLTGDYTKPGLVSIIMGVALILIVVLIVSLRRKK